ncbi:MAG: aminotransferase class V-fold PLP-dependent enzyme [Xanthomonadales bacterium]|nr:aminotransferase class V-fold PLP-dependent enzyme [Xanthomonadales bacterium]
MSRTDTLGALEAQARLLDPNGDVRQEMLKQATAYAEQFLEGLPGGKTYQPADDDGGDWPVGPGEEGESMAALLAQLARHVDAPGINPASGGHLGYIPGGGLYPSAVGGFLAGVTNRYSGVHFASPGAVRMEQELVRWMADLAGLPASAGGDLTSGGSTANLSAIVAARDAAGMKAADVPRSCVYMTRQVHHCVDKALRVAGLAECPIRFVPMDGRFRMDESLLAEQIEADRKQGLKPWMVVASAGTTDTGAVDPLLKIASICRAEGLWLHVDAAYGGFFLLCEEGRRALAGLDRADSIVMDPHKGLFLPYGTGAILVREVDRLARAHHYHADYMQDAATGAPGYSPADLSPELSRPFRGLGLWLPLKLFGLAPFRAALAEKIELARYFHEQVSEIPGFAAGPFPDLSVVTFVFNPRQEDRESANRRLLQAVQQDGRVFISSTRVNAEFTLRAAILHFRTHRAEVDHLLGILRDTAREIDA